MKMGSPRERKFIDETHIDPCELDSSWSSKNEMVDHWTSQHSISAPDFNHLLSSCHNTHVLIHDYPKWKELEEEVAGNVGQVAFLQ